MDSRRQAGALAAHDKKTPANGERIQKVLSSCGLASRRTIESWVAAGKITVNGEVAQLGKRITQGDRVSLEGVQLRIAHVFSAAQDRKVLMYHKPCGELCSRKDPQGRATVFERLPLLEGRRWVSVGRLDYNTSGLLLFTNDGELSNRLSHPQSQLDREYLVRVSGRVSPEQLERMRSGVEIDGETMRFIDIQPAGQGLLKGRNNWYGVVLQGGRNREVRKLWQSQGLEVSRLRRVRFGPLALPNWLKPGQHAELDEREVSALCASLPLTRSNTRSKSGFQDREHKPRNGKKSRARRRPAERAR